jgi:hypothetical protein
VVVDAKIRALELCLRALKQKISRTRTFTGYPRLSAVHDFQQISRHLHAVLGLAEDQCEEDRLEST